VIKKEGKHKKFIRKVEQITYSGEYSVEKKQKVLYVTERAVFTLKDGRMHLLEIAPGIDVKKHVLPFMDFEPVIDGELKTMDSRIFGDAVMNVCENAEMKP